MAERFVTAFVKKTAMTSAQRDGAIAGAATFLHVPVDSIVMREVSPAVVLARDIINPGGQMGDWGDQGVAETDYGYEIFVIG